MFLQSKLHNNIRKKDVRIITIGGDFVDIAVAPLDSFLALVSRISLQLIPSLFSWHKLENSPGG